MGGQLSRRVRSLPAGGPRSSRGSRASAGALLSRSRQGRSHPMRPRTIRFLSFGFAAILVTGCAGARSDTANSTPAAVYEPSRALGTLFHDIQMARVFPDGKTFVDARPRTSPREIVARYARERGTPAFDLRAFAEREFDIPRPYGGGYRADTTMSMEQ